MWPIVFLRKARRQFDKERAAEARRIIDYQERRAEARRIINEQIRQNAEEARRQQAAGAELRKLQEWNSLSDEQKLKRKHGDCYDYALRCPNGFQVKLFKVGTELYRAGGDRKGERMYWQEAVK